VWAEARTVKYAGRNVQIVPYDINPKNLVARRFAVFIDFVHGSDVHLMTPRKRRCTAWRCSCHLVLERKESLVAHIATHYLRGIGAQRIPYPGEVHSHERRVRLSWRTHSDDPRYQ
jgi:hypothetical protein